MAVIGTLTQVSPLIIIAETPLVILNIVFAPFSFPFFTAGTPYAGGMFKMKLVLGKNFPSEPPKGFFLTKIFHPNVASNGEICVNTLKKDWNADLGIKHLLLVRL